ncbi:MAG TPA: glutathione-disulfide reductase [Rhizomicrobium sp.]|jgi:glutathione reductase (NADPH)|nr:glutathione-disulfide reductase [Rhizomicrobium sp.]
MKYDYDFFVIGGGSGGVRAARMAGQRGKRTAIAEEYAFGGTCVIRGCIPKKLLVYAAQFGEDFEDAAGFGWTVPERHFDWPMLIANKDKEIARLSDLYTQNVMKAGVEIFMDRAELLDAHTIHLKKIDRKFTAERILIATGGRPVREIGPDVTGAEHCITSNEAFYLKEFPKRIVIAGGGYISVEFANIFHGLGSDVTLLCRRDKVLNGFDEDMRDCLTDSMQTSGLRVVSNRNITRIDKTDGKLFAFTDHGEMIEADQVMLAIGRQPCTEGLGLDKAGVAVGKKNQIKVDEFSKTSAEHIYAIGDVTERLPLTPVAIYEAMCLSRTLWDDAPTAVDYDNIATAVFSRPEIATVGLTEAKALEKGHAIDVYKSTFRPLKHTLSGRDHRAQFKLVVDSKTNKILGCHIFGFDAGEIIQAVAIAVKMGATKADFDSTIAIHPTAAEELVTMRTKSYSKP